MPGSKGLQYEKLEQALQTTAISFVDVDILDEYTWMVFPSGVSWTPQRLKVNGRKGRRAACVLAEDNFNYRIYDMDNRERDEAVKKDSTAMGS